MVSPLAFGFPVFKEDQSDSASMRLTAAAHQNIISMAGLHGVPGMFCTLLDCRRGLFSDVA